MPSWLRHPLPRMTIEEEVKSQQDSIQEDLLKKAEQKMNESKSETTKTDYISEDERKDQLGVGEEEKKKRENGKVTSLH